MATVAQKIILICLLDPMVKKIMSGSSLQEYLSIDTFFCLPPDIAG
jgi:hypothetical protein